MDVFSWIALVVLIALIVLFVYALVALAKWPGDIARKRGHPQAEAITWLGWMGILLTAGVAWIIAMTWAHTNPPTVRVEEKD